MKLGWPFRAQDWGLDWVIPKIARVCRGRARVFGPPPYMVMCEVMRKSALTNERLRRENERMAHELIKRAKEYNLGNVTMGVAIQHIEKARAEAERGNGDAA